MKKIIDGKVYNTKTAIEIASWHNDFYAGDFKECGETLYQTKKGAYFIHGEGGAMSKYSESCGNCSTWGSDIIPISKNRVVKWLESTKNYEILEDLFPEELEEA